MFRVFKGRNGEQSQSCILPMDPVVRSLTTVVQDDRLQKKKNPP